jgi:hypothetical protein
MRDFDSTLVVPSDVGCTGLAIETRKVVAWNSGNPLEKYFRSEVDNCDGLAKVDSMMISSVWDQ